MFLINGRISIADQGNNSFQQWSLAGVQLSNITTFNSGNTFNSPWGVALDPRTGYLYVADGNNGVLRVFTFAGTYVTTLNLGLSDVRGIAFSNDCRSVYVTDYNGGGYIYAISGTKSLPIFTLTGNFGQSGPGTLVHAYQLTVDRTGNLWVADYSGGDVKVYDSNGVYIKTLTSASFSVPTDVKVLYDGTTLVTDEGAGQVFVFNSAGTQIGAFGSGVLGYPEDIELYNGRFYVSDWNNSQIVVFQ